MNMFRVFLIVIGLILFVGGISAAVVNRVTTGQNLNCETATKAEAEMNEAQKAYENTKGTLKEVETLETYRKKMRLFDMSSKSCSERNQEYFYYFLGFVGVGIVGFFLFAIGGASYLRGRNRGVSAS